MAASYRERLSLGRLVMRNMETVHMRMEEELKQSFLSFNVFCNSKYCLGQSSHMYVKSEI